ncbi:MAG: hypothetical protein C7K11_09780 [Candidatus Amulumruptor caecigallinarius]|nr:MAG: hypothetical protein C7K11_09780 [Candidatus Amulumruptor caecigallinarius]
MPHERRISARDRRISRLSVGDVCGFLRDPDGCILCGVWKVYENVGEAARTFERFRRCSACICRHMDRGRTLSQIFNVG